MPIKKYLARRSAKRGLKLANRLRARKWTGPKPGAPRKKSGLPVIGKTPRRTKIKSRVKTAIARGRARLGLGAPGSSTKKVASRARYLAKGYARKTGRRVASGARRVGYSARRRPKTYALAGASVAGGSYAVSRRRKKKTTRRRRRR